jgi:drug/metabolite transporter (DMT)-like permease
MGATAVILILISAFMHAGWNFFSKRLYPTTEVYMTALTGGALILLPLILGHWTVLSAVPTRVWLLVLGAGLFQALYFSGLAGAYRNGDLSVAYPVARALPVLLVLIISYILGRGDEISLQAAAGSVIVVIAAFFLPMRYLGELRLRNYFNWTSLFALCAAIGTMGYSVLDDAALQLLRSPAVLGSRLPVLQISYLYLAFEAVTTILWMVLFFAVDVKLLSAGSPDRSRSTPILPAVLMGLMIYATYGLVLTSMAYVEDVSYVVAFRQVSLPIGVLLGLLILHEQGGWLRFSAVLFMVAGLILVAAG